MHYYDYHFAKSKSILTKYAAGSNPRPRCGICMQHRNNDPPNLPAHFITQREIAEAAPVEYLQKHGF